MRTKIIVVGAGGLLLIPIGWQLGGALGALVTAHAGLIGIVGGGLLLALALGGLRIVFAAGRLASARARIAELTTLQNGQPIHVSDLSLYAAPLTAHTLDRHYEVEKVRAAVPPALTSYHNEVHPVAPAELLAGLLGAGGSPPPPPLPQITDGGSGPQLEQLRRLGHVCRSGNSLLVGYADGTPQYIELADCGFIGIGGKPRVGKSVTASLLIDQAVLSGWQVFVGDPHAKKADGLLNRLQPLAGRLARQATTAEEIADMVRTVDRIGRRRVEGLTSIRTPVLVIIDEFSNLVWRKDLPPDVLAILPSMAVEYAGVGVHGILIAHDWSKASLGNDLGAALRRALTHRIIHRMDPGNVEFLLPASGAGAARTVQGLAAGQVLYNGPDGTVTATVPLVGDDDAVYAAQHAPERPKPVRPAQLAPAPAQPPAEAPIAPTERVAPPAPPRAAPETEQLKLTVKERICMALDGRRGQWLTHSEIATALGPDADVGVVQTEAKELYDNGFVARRSCRRNNERLEYSTNQSTNPYTVPTYAKTA